MSGWPDAPLTGTTVLVTRPAHQADALCGLIESAGGTALRMPALDIAPPSDPGALHALGGRLDAFDLAVFVSANAVSGALAHLGTRLPGSLKLAAIGPASAQALMDAGYTDVVCPASGFDSESLLALPALKDVSGARIVIFRGDAGRGLLAEVLRERGARVEYAEVYRRESPPAPDPAVAGALRSGRVDAVIVTSARSLENLVELCTDKMRRGLLRAQLVVVSARMIEMAEALGFTTPLVAAEPGDRAIFETLVAWRTGHSPQETADPT